MDKVIYYHNFSYIICNYINKTVVIKSSNLQNIPRQLLRTRKLKNFSPPQAPPKNFLTYPALRNLGVVCFW